MGDGKTKLVVEDYRTAPIDEKLRAMLGLLETFTLDPDQLTPGSLLAVIATGVTREAIRDAFYVAFLFNTYDRLADTLGSAFVPLDAERGAARVVAPGHRIDLADFRAPTLEADLAGRDFTVDAMAVPLGPLLRRGRAATISTDP